MTQDIPTVAEAAAAAFERGHSEGPLPIEDLDRVLRPLRRVVAFALQGDDKLDQVRYFEVNGGRWMGVALRLDLPHAVRDLLAQIKGRLDGYDSAEAGDRRARMSAIHQLVTRVDALLGLPLDERVIVPRRDAARAEAEDWEVEPVTDEAIVADELAEATDTTEAADARDERRPRGESISAGRPLTALEADPATLQALAEEGVETVFDLLALQPTGEEILRPVHGAGRDIPTGRVAVGGRVRNRATVFRGEGGRDDVIVVMGAGPLRACWRGGLPAWLRDRLTSGARVVLVGELAPGPNGEPVLWDAEPAVPDGQHAVHLARYGLDNVDDRAVRALVTQALPDLDRLRDPLPHDTLQRVKLPGLAEALRELHLRGSARPESRRRLAFDEALLVQLGLAAPRYQAHRERGVAHAVLHGLVSRVCQYFEIVLSDAQQAALEDIKRDLRSSTPMLRVLTGEAGGGKGLVALLSAIVVAESKSQVAIVAPDAVSAEQRFLFAEPVLREVGLVGRLVTGDPTRAQRDAIRRGEVHVVFGAADLLDREVEFRRLGLLIAEEREVFGRAPAKVAAMRAPRPDLLVLVPVPLPPPVLLSAYGDHDLSLVAHDTKPPRGTVYTDEQRVAAYQSAAEAIAKRQQVLVVFPLARGADVLDAREAQRVVEAYRTEVFPGARVGLMHGAMSREERWRAYDDFRHHRVDVLVATTPPEEGPMVPSATVVVLEAADRMSVCRLLRLRSHVSPVSDEDGRPIGRVLYVLGREPEPAAVERVERLARLEDGWSLMDGELAARGLDAMLAPEVPQAARLRWVDPTGDRQLLLQAREEAHRILEEDPGLRRPAHQDLSRALRDRWEELLSLPFPLQEAAGAPGATAPRRRRRRRKRR